MERVIEAWLNNSRNKVEWWRSLCNESLEFLGANGDVIRSRDTFNFSLASSWDSCSNWSLLTFFCFNSLIAVTDDQMANEQQSAGLNYFTDNAEPLMDNAQKYVSDVLLQFSRLFGLCWMLCASLISPRLVFLFFFYYQPFHWSLWPNFFLLFYFVCSAHFSINRRCSVSDKRCLLERRKKNKRESDSLI